MQQIFFSYGVWSVNDDESEIFDEDSDETEMKRQVTYHEEGFL